MTAILRDLHAHAPVRLDDGCLTVLGMDHLVISLSADGRASEPVWSSGATGTAFEDLQFTTGEGPGPDALRTGEAVLEYDVAVVASARWPALMPAAAALPVQAVFCIPLAFGGITVGVLTLLRATPGHMSGQEMDDVLGLGATLTWLFLDGESGRVDAWVDAQPHGELHRAVVHQATGMLSVHLSLPLNKALLRLRAYAYRHDRLITEVAEDVVSRRLRLDDDMPRTDPTTETRG